MNHLQGKLDYDMYENTMKFCNKPRLDFKKEKKSAGA